MIRGLSLQLLLWGLSCTVGCTPADQEPDVALVDHLSWMTTPTTSDPLAQHRPGEVSCPETSWAEEDGTLEVDTTTCNYLSLDQPSAAAVAAGQRVRIVLWHDRLDAEQPGQAHAAITLSDQTIWERLIPIPSDAAVYDEQVTITMGANQSVPVGLHLHNHGDNTWNLLEITRLGQ
ncbi:MAG TPA: hypothetical protein DIU15_01370 [Deltaproteobacteria bacterium]|nr:hypothetical protein [Deltaproteobacteria bacterium]HCP44674.1 hypothetical protein [Deltaproteobacteria bacterium]